MRAARLIGVNTAIATVPNEAGQSGGGSVGLGFAIAVDVAMPIAAELIADGRVTHYTAGMDLQPVPPLVAQRAGIPQGLVVTTVEPAGAAARAGMAAGDVVVAINGEAATNPEQLTIAELGARSGNGGGTAIAVVYSRAGKQTSVSITPTRAGG